MSEQKTAIKKNGDVIVYELRRPKIVDGKEYKSLELDFSSLTGNDLIAAESEMTSMGQIVVTMSELNKAYLIIVSARAAKVPSEVIAQLSIKDVSAITRLAQNFLMDDSDE